MKLFLRDNKGYIFIYILSMVLSLVYSSLRGFIGLSEVIYIAIFNTFILLAFLIFKYYQNRELYRFLTNGCKDLNDVFLNLGSSELSQNISRVLKDIHGLYKGEIQKSNKIHSEHLKFINQWVHQMKTPLSVIQLQLQEYEGEKIYYDMQEEIDKLKEGLNMAMHFARLSSFKKDFLVEKVCLKKITRDVINEEKRVFIKNGIIPKIEINENIEVYSDAKWLKFILSQIIINGVKYSKDIGRELIIISKEDEGEVKLSIIDKGIGISAKDIKRVFDPFFTGENGRKYRESTGMGLYITKEVCKNLSHEVEIESALNKGTKVTIIFKK